MFVLLHDGTWYTAAVDGAIEVLAGRLSSLPGVVAVALGGSRALGRADPGSDWDLGLYYRDSRRRLDPGDIRALGYAGEVSEHGGWGPVMSGGAWLRVGDPGATATLHAPEGVRVDPVGCAGCRRWPGRRPADRRQPWPQPSGAARLGRQRG